MVVCLLMLTAFGADAQSRGSLEVSSYRGHKIKFLDDGANVQITKNDKKYKGQLKILSDQSILVNSDTILISQVQEISAKTVSSHNKGVALVVPGGIVGILGVGGIVAGISEGGYGLLGAIVLTPVAAIGVIVMVKGIQLLSNGKRFSSSKWKYKVVLPSR